jgi:hypothetical protein
MSKQNDQNRTAVPTWIVLVAIAALVAALIALIVTLLRRREHPAREPVVVRFPEGHMTVTVPPQSRPVLVIERPLPPLDQLQSDRDEFKPKELLVNFEVMDAENPETPISFFDPPLKIEVAYTQAQVEAAQKDAETFREYVKGQLDQPRPLLGFWDSTHWILFMPIKHHLTYRPNEDPTTGGVATVQVERWADPPTGWWP